MELRDGNYELFKGLHLYIKNKLYLNLDLGKPKSSLICEGGFINT